MIKGVYGREMFETWYKMAAMLQSGLDIAADHHAPLPDRRFPRRLRDHAQRPVGQGHPRLGRMRRAAKIAAALVGALALLLAGFAALNWAPDRPVAELTARWAQPPSSFIDIAGMQVHVRDEGVRDDPVPIILLHGTSASLHTWDGWVRELEPFRRVIRVDMPGFGLTGPCARRRLHDRGLRAVRDRRPRPLRHRALRPRRQFVRRVGGLGNRAGAARPRRRADPG